MTEHVTIDELPDAVREQTDDLPWAITGLDAGRIDKNECYCCGDEIYTVQAGGDWVELDKTGEDRGFVMHLSDTGAMPQALDQERAQEQPLACGYCMESLFDYGFSEIYAITPSEHAVGMIDSGVIQEHYMDEYDSIHRCRLWDQVLAVARGDDWGIEWPSEAYDTGEEYVELSEGAMVDALAVAAESLNYYQHDNYRRRDAFVDAIREEEITLPFGVVIYGSSLYANDHAIDRVGEAYAAFLEEQNE